MRDLSEGNTIVFKESKAPQRQATEGDLHVMLCLSPFQSPLGGTDTVPKGRE